MAEMYGAKALEAKFGATPPDTWRIAIDRLKDFELERGIRRMVYGGKPHLPSLPEFMRMCREVGGDDFASADHKPLPPSRQIEQQPMARWEREASEHLLGYITRKARERVYFTDPQVVQKLVDAKRYWAEDMRERDGSGDRPADGGKQIWLEYIGAAEEAIAMMHRAAA